MQHQYPKPKNSMSTRKPSYFLVDLSPLSKTFALLTNEQAANMLRNECSCVKPCCTSLLCDCHCNENPLQLLCEWMTQTMPGGDMLQL